MWFSWSSFGGYGYKLSLRDLAEMFLIRGIVFTHEAVRDWEARLSPLLTDALRQRRRGKAGRSWYTDETYIKVGGWWQKDPGTGQLTATATWSMST